MNEGYRLNKSSPFFLLLNIIKNTIFPLVLGIYSSDKYISKYGDHVFGIEMLIIAVVTVLSLLSILQYWFYHYWIREEELEVKEGIFSVSYTHLTLPTTPYV